MWQSLFPLLFELTTLSLIYIYIYIILSYIYLQGNYVALNEEEIAQLPTEDYERRLERSYSILANAGAHYVIDTINDLPPVIDDINRRLANGESP